MLFFRTIEKIKGNIALRFRLAFRVNGLHKGLSVLNSTLNESFFVTIFVGLINEFKIGMHVVNDWLKDILLFQINSELSFVSGSVQISESFLRLNILRFSSNPLDVIHSSFLDFVAINSNLNISLR